MKKARSAGEGLERSCRGVASAWLAGSGPVGGVELLRARFAGEAYQTHRHDTYAVGVTDAGVQVFDYRGSTHASTRGKVVVLYPDEAHNGRAGSDEGFGYRIVYVEPAALGRAVLMAGERGGGPAISRRVDVAAVERARQFLDAAKTRGVHSRELEAVTGLTRYDLSRQFRLVLGTSPHRYLLMRRLDFARELIQRDRPLVDVAGDAGFADQAHVTRAFKSAVGLTPARYRALKARRAPAAALSR